MFDYLKKTKLKLFLLLATVFLLCGCSDVSDASSALSLSSDEPETSVSAYFWENEKANSEEDALINVRKEVIEVEGLTRERHIFFVADSHISMCDERDSELLEKAASRAAGFCVNGIASQDRFSALIARANRLNYDLVMLGGDIVDSAMYASIEYVGQQLSSLNSPYLYLTGNHDYEYGSEYFTQAAYFTYRPRLSEFHEDRNYHVYEDDEIIYLALDDLGDRIDEDALAAYKELAKKGKPIVVSTHVPIQPYTEDASLIEDTIEIWGDNYGKSLVVIGRDGSASDAVTKEFIELLLSEDSPVVLVLAGHIHMYHYDMLNDKVVQLSAGAAFEGEALDITLR